MRKILCLIAGCLLVSTAQAAEAPDASLFFTQEEAQAVETLAAKTAPAADHGDVHLGAVFYYGPDDWVLWLQGEKWTPATERADMRVIAVQPDEVRLGIAPASGMALREVTLKPYQTFQLSTGAVFEGALAAAPADRSR